MVATAVTAPVIRVDRISSLTSAPPTVTAGAFGSLPCSSGNVSAARATAGRSAVSIPWSRHHHVRARYIAPVSRYPNPKAAATARDTLDFPDPDGPSTAMVTGLEDAVMGVDPSRR